MPAFEVRVMIENKPGISDPEGETILKDLVLRGGRTFVSSIRTAKMLKFTVTEETARSAEEKVAELCDDLRIYNPMVSTVAITASDA